ncbi:hypothetical protein OESDEN_13677 [Oesophagostomum dentatum]|uniref:Uncharacterized protein n=1 Tax=Oesophagostomum dentatum TaxID=61180 RepID=A0A0B1SRP8_OESDE|nr:hypothetical protein OESDEN_13677 [Oesophagostomum dentatum]
MLQQGSPHQSLFPVLQACLRGEGGRSFSAVRCAERCPAGSQGDRGVTAASWLGNHCLTSGLY